MKKFYSFLAMVLVTLMAVGNAAAFTSVNTGLAHAKATGILSLKGVGDSTVTPATLPYFVDFDSNVDTSLEINNGSYVNQWYIGQAQGFDNKKLYISSSNGVTNKYNVTQRSTVTVSRDIIIPAMGANISFDYRVGGEADKDYLSVDLVSASGTQNIATLQGAAEWSTFNYVLGPQYAGQVKIVFTWTNDAADGEQSPAAIDNISIVEALCAELTALTITADTGSATIQWSLNDLTQTNWLLQYKLSNHTDWYSLNATSTTVTLTGLQGSSHYDVRVQAVCGDEVSAWLTGSFSTPCGDSREDVVMAVNGEATTNIVPFNNGSRYSWNEMIFKADQMGDPGIITALKLDCASSGATMTLSTLKIYMANTSRTVHSNNKDWEEQDNLVLVYDGTNVEIGGSAAQTLTLNTPFEYTGENLVLVVSKSSAAANANISFLAETQSENVILYRGAAGAAYANYPANASGALLAGTLGTMLPNVTITKTACNDAVSCPDLTDFAVSDITAAGATFSWTAGDANQTNFLLQYKKADETEWTDVPCNTTTYTFDNLDHSTQYVVRVKAICGENDESNFTDEIAFETLNPCPMVTDIMYSNMSTTTTLSWTPGGSETAWQVRFRPTTPAGQDYIIINVNTLPTTTFGGLSPNTDYECAIKAICDGSESYWAEIPFSTGCSGIDFDYSQDFASATKPDCWEVQDFTFNGENASASQEAWLISPAMNVPATTESFVAFDVQGGAYQVMASYRGTAQNRFTTIFEGEATTETQHIIIPIPELYKDKTVNFAIVSTGELVVDNVEFTKCAYVPSELTVVKPEVNSVDLQWLANGGTDFVVEYTVDGTTWTSLNVTGTSDTVQYTVEGLEGNTEYTFRVICVCNGNMSAHYSNEVTVKTYCEAVSVPYAPELTALPECWNVVFTGNSPQTTVVTQNNQLVMYNFGTGSAAQADQIGDLFVILPSFDTTLNRLLISFAAAKYSNNISSKFYLGVITDINDPTTFTQIRDFNLTSTTSTEYVCMLNSINENLYHGYLAFRMKVVDATVPQAAVLSNIEVDFIPRCAKPTNFKMVEGSMTASSIELTWEQPSNANNWDIKYGETGFDVETSGTTATANLRPRTIAGLSFGVTYDFYVRAHCSNVYQSEWVGPVTVEMDIPYIMGEDNDITTCVANIYDDGGKEGSYSNQKREYMIIRPVDPATTVTHLQGNYDLENNFDYIYVYDGDDTTETPVRTLTGTGTLDISSTTGPLTLVMVTDAATVASGFAFRVSCVDAPSCSSPRNLSFFNTSLSWENGVYGTPVGYEISYRNIQTPNAQTVTSTTNSYAFTGLTIGDSYEFKVRSICGVGDTSDWVTKTIVIPCPLKNLPYEENFDSYTSTTSYSTSTKHPDCWNSGREGTSTSYYVSIYPTASYAHSTSNSLRFYNYSLKPTSSTNLALYGDIYAVLPAVNANLNQLHLTGWIRRYSANTSTATMLYKADMTVGVTTNLDDVMNNFTEITTYSVHNTSIDYEYFDINLSNYSGPEGYLVLVSKVPVPADTTTYNYFCIDDLEVDYIPECGTPRISVDGSLLTINQTSTLNTPQSYEVMIGERTVNIGNVTSYDLTDITGLASNTEYTVKVRAICSATSNSEWSNEEDYTTPCLAQEVPYTENFNGYFTPATSTTAPAATSLTPYPNHNMPDCWIFPRMSTTTSSYPQYFLTSSTTGAVTGNCLIIRGAANSTAATAAFAILPALNANLNDLQITFTYRSGSTGAATYGDLYVGYMTDYNDPSTFVQVGTTTKTTTKTELTFSFGNVEFSGGEYYIAFKYQGGSSAGNHVFIDDVSVEYITCQGSVTNLSADVDGTTATVTWQGTADSYDLEYGETGFALGQGTRVTGITGTTYTINNVAGSNDVYVRANCGNGTAGMWSQTTACAPVSLPYSEDFSRYVSSPTANTTPGELPACYDYDFHGTAEGTTNYSPKVQRNISYSPYGVNSNPYLWMISGTSATYGTPEHPSYVVLPQFTQPLNRLSVSFTARISSATNGQLELGYVSSSAEFTTLTPVTCSTVSATAPVVRTYNLDQYDNIPSDARLAFRLAYITTANSSVNVGIDDILIEELPFCVTPQIAGVSSITTTTADVEITPSSNAQNYEVVCENVDDPTDTHTATANTSDYTAHVTGLAPQATYKVKVRAFCGGSDYSDWSDFTTFMTKCLAVTLPYSEDFNSYTGTVTSTTAPTGYPDHPMPSCWLFLNMSSNTGAYPQMFLTSYSSYVVSGNCLFFKSSSTTPAFAILPAFNHNLSQMQLTFTYRNEGVSASNGTLHVGYMSDADDPSTFVSVKTCDQTTTLTPVVVQFNESGITSDNYYIAFKYVGGTANNYYVSVDNILMDVMPYCSAPIIDSVVTTETTANVYIASNPDAQTYQAIAVAPDADPNTATATPAVADGNHMAQITGLNPQTEYDFYARVICDSATTSNWSFVMSARTQCAPVDVPYTTSFEDDGTLDKETFGTSYPLTYCWNKINDKENSTLVYPYSYSGATYAHSGSRSLYIYNYMTGSTTSYSYEDLYAVLPAMNVDSINKLRIKFYARESSTSDNYISHLEVGVMTDPNVASTFVKIADVNPTTTTHVQFVVPFDTYTGNGKYIAIKAPRPHEAAPGQTSNYNVTYIDDILVDYIPDCSELTDISVDSITDAAATVTFGDDNHIGSYTIEYRMADETAWQIVPTDTTVVTLTNLQPMTSYVVRAHTICDSVHSGPYTEDVSFFTRCVDGADVIVGTGTASSYFYGPYNNFYKNSWNQSMYTSDEIGGSGVIRGLSRKVVAAAPYTMNTLKIYMGVTNADQIQSTSDWMSIDNMTLVYDGTNVTVGKKEGWEILELQTPFLYNGTDNLVIVTAKKSSNYISALTYEYTNLSSVYRNLYRYSDSDTSYAEAPIPGTTTGTRSYYRANVGFLLCPLENNLTIDSIVPIADACDLSAATVTVRVKNNSYVNSASGFVMTCQVDGVDGVITDSVSRTLLPQESFLYTFSQPVPFMDGSNNITVSALYDNDENPADNTITLNDIRLVTPAEVPYYQDFSTKINFGRDAWVLGDFNQNPNKWTQENEMMVFEDNDTLDAQSYFITSCIEMPAGQYKISYDYNALSMLPENLNVYIGTTQDISQMTLIGQHQGFVKTDEDQTFEYLFDNTDAGVYYIAVEALSQMGNMGITFDNLNVEPIVAVTVVEGANGTVSPNGVNYVVYGDDFSINIIPNEMYHVAGVWVDGERVMNEDPFNASFMMYTLSNITEPHTINVEFKLEFHINKFVVNANSEYEPGGYFIPAEADTLLDPSAHTVYFAAEPHNHFVSLVVGYQPPVAGGYVYGDDVTADVLYDDATNTYSYTIDTLIVANYYIQAMFRRDTVNVHYTALAGDGIFDGVTVSHGNSYNTWVDYGSDHTSTIAPADGFYTMGVTVNAVNMGIIDHYDFDSIVTTQNVMAQFGHKVTASIHNLNDLSYLGSDEVRGTIAPAEQMIVHGTSCSVSGTLQEHFHLGAFLVNGVDMLSDVVFNGNAYTFTIDSLVENTDIVAEVQIDQVAIYYMVDGGNGYVNGNEMNAPAYDTLYIDYMSNWMSMFEAATGYHIVNVMVNGTSYNEIPQWLTEFITEPQHIVITFALNEYDITTAAHGNGTVSAGAHIVYSPTSSYTFTATPAVGHHISQILRNNEYLTITDPEATYTETISPVLSDYNYVAFFEPNIYTITATADANGTIDPYGAQNFEYGSTPTFTVTPNAGYVIDQVLVDGEPVTLTNGTYTFAPLTGNHTISATFVGVNYTITATAGANGTITPSGAQTVAAGSMPTYTIAPATGYEIADVTVDGVSVGAVSTYTFEPVNANHTINATFSQINLVITATAGANGTITPSGNITVAYGASHTFTVAPATGYEVDYVTVDGMEVYLTNNTYTFSNITVNHAIFVAFRPSSYTITVTDPTNGTISPNGVVTVGYQATPTFLITPAFGYEVTAITVNGTNVLNDAVAQGTGAYTYTFPPVTANRTLTATMTKKSYTITKLTPDNHGTITGPNTVDYGENAAYTITPSAGYLIDNVLVDGMSVGAVSSYIFHNVTANHTISATFKREICIVPTSLHAENVDSTSATLAWYHPGADSYDIQYKNINDPTWTLVQNVPGFAYSLTNLQPNTYYVFQVKANCGNGNESGWSNGFTFKTPAVVPQVGVADYVKDHVKVYAEHNRVHIVNDFAVEIENVAIYDMYGKLIYSGNAINNPEVIELNVAIGTYVVRLNTVQGPAVYKVHINR